MAEYAEPIDRHLLTDLNDLEDAGMDPGIRIEAPGTAYCACGRQMSARVATMSAPVLPPGYGARIVRVDEPPSHLGWKDYRVLRYVFGACRHHYADHRTRLTEEEAVRQSEAAIELEPGNPRLHGDLGNILHHFGEYEAAVRAFDRAIELDPRRRIQRSGRAASLAALGRLPEALRDYREALRPRSTVSGDSMPDAGVVPWVARLMVDQGPERLGSLMECAESRTVLLDLLAILDAWCAVSPERSTVAADLRAAGLVEAVRELAARLAPQAGD
jgi:hypothetical protein